VAVVLGVVRVTQGSSTTQSAMYGAAKKLPSKNHYDNLSCETRAERMMRFKNGDRSVEYKQVCPNDVEVSTKAGTDIGSGSVCSIVENHNLSNLTYYESNNALNLTLFASTPDYLPDLCMFSQALLFDFFLVLRSYLSFSRFFSTFYFYLY
jgi:hypothetical protein